ncbi:hypothetical protein F4801DRAFT_597070 [Xylaria longipes]|nr:hypothetical protein F4801DRAFT_597070 [Xylaria longipes]
MASGQSKKDRITNLNLKKRVKHVDVLIVGSGPIGAVYARTLIDAGMSVLMVDMGAQSSRLAGDHHKNSVVVQKDLSLFTNVGKTFIYGNLNPDQHVEDNLNSSAASRVVGGMSTHWTCCTPRQHLKERSTLFTAEKWNELYEECEKLFDTDTTGEALKDSVRQQLVMRKLKDAFKQDFENGFKTKTQQEPRKVLPMPLACKIKNKSYIEWSCTASILGDLANPNNDPRTTDFTLMSQTQCDVLYIDAHNHKVEAAIIVDLVNDEEWLVKAEKYVICGGAVLTAGILAKSVSESGLDLDEFCPALGKYLTEQTMTFCQVVLKQEFIDGVIKDPRSLDEKNSSLISGKIEAHRAKHHEKDPVPFPFHDFDPQVYTPYSDEYPWHTQIHRDAFGYGELPSNVDPRLVVDLRFFAQVEASEKNCISWENDSKDSFGMLQPTFHFRMSKEDRKLAHKMMTDMTHVASLLGGFVPGAEPRHMAPGLAQHICGIYRAGKDIGEKETSVVSREGKVWDMDDLYLGGCGIIPIGNASNPTLTAACHALASANQIVNELKDASV